MSGLPIRAWYLFYISKCQSNSSIKTDKFKRDFERHSFCVLLIDLFERTVLFISTLFWLTAFLAPVTLKLTSQKLVLAKISKKRPFFKVEVMGAYLRVGAHSRGVLM